MMQYFCAKSIADYGCVDNAVITFAIIVVLSHIDDIATADDAAAGDDNDRVAHRSAALAHR